MILGIKPLFLKLEVVPVCPINKIISPSAQILKIYEQWDIESYHCVCLSSTCLPISNDRTVVAFDCVGNDVQGTFFKHLLLRCIVKNSIKLK